jgi:hypothetical protein
MGFPPLNPEVLKDDRYQRYYQTDGDFYDGYPMHPYGLQHAWRGGRHFSPLNRQWGGYPYNSFAVPESFKSAKSPSKFLDEMPKNETKIDDEVDGFQHQKYKGKYDLTIEEKLKKLKNTASPFPTMATVQGKHYDQNLDKKTVYDLTEDGDWRYGTKTSLIGGPIDHVNKNKNVNKKNP